MARRYISWRVANPSLEWGPGLRLRTLLPGVFWRSGGTLTSTGLGTRVGLIWRCHSLAFSRAVVTTMSCAGHSSLLKAIGVGVGGSGMEDARKGSVRSFTGDFAVVGGSLRTGRCDRVGLSWRRFLNTINI